MASISGAEQAGRGASAHIVVCVISDFGEADDEYLETDNIEQEESQLLEEHVARIGLPLEMKDLASDITQSIIAGTENVIPSP